MSTLQSLNHPYSLDSNSDTTVKHSTSSPAFTHKSDENTQSTHDDDYQTSTTTTKISKTQPSRSDNNTNKETNADSLYDSDSDNESDTDTRVMSNKKKNTSKSSPMSSESAQTNTSNTEPNTESNTEIPESDNVFLKIANVLLVVVILLVVAYLVYWVIENVYNINVYNYIKHALFGQSNSVSAGAMASVAAASAAASTLVQDKTQKSHVPASSKQYAFTPTTASTYPTNSNNTSKNMPLPVSHTLTPHLASFDLPSSAPHARNSSNVGESMKQRLSDKSISALLEEMSKIRET